MSIEIIIYGTFSIVLAIILLVYSIFVIIEEREKMKYYKYNILYVTNWDKYNTMVKKQKRVLFKKKIQLTFLTVFVRVRRLFKWH